MEKGSFWPTPNVATNEVKALRTDATGPSVQPLLLAGSYDAALEKEGFRSGKQRNVKLDLGQNRSVNFGLEVGALTQEPRVEAAPPPLDVNTSSIGQVMERRRISRFQGLCLPFDATHQQGGIRK